MCIRDRLQGVKKPEPERKHTGKGKKNEKLPGAERKKTAWQYATLPPNAFPNSSDKRLRAALAPLANYLVPSAYDLVQQ